MLPLPLAHKRVVDLTSSIAGASASHLLGEFGAEVVLVEPPQGGLRRSDPQGFAELGRNKLGCVIDLSRDEGWHTLLELVARSDVVLTDSVDLAGEDGGYEAFASVRSDVIVVFIGEGRERPGPGRVAAAAAMTALFHKRAGGEGQLARVAIREAAVSMRTASVVAAAAGLAGASPDLSPSGCYACSDGSLALVVRSGEQRQALLELVGGAANGGGEGPIRAVQTWAKDLSADSAAAMLRDVGVVAERIRRPEELMHDPHLRARGSFEQVASASGLTEMPGPSYRFSLTPTHTRLAAPALGEHNGYVLKELLGR
jgi:crotonobetainyl-CoA:carnitine CoA-transferase CaiB-like acyl-CoA transferase